MRREEMLEAARYKNQASRYANVDEVDDIVAEWTRQERRDELVATFMEHGIPCAPVRSLAEVTADPENTRRRMLIDSESAARGRIKVMGTPLKFSDKDDEEHMPMPPPVLGEHTAEVLATLGVDEAELARLRESGIV
jgi:crotonobetainyl-CoA:carnitine CoA-transferase CaiB-like acyl-CoA transferase